MKPSKQQGRQTDQSVCLMQVKETAERRRASIHPSFHFVTLFVQFTSREAKTSRRRDEGWEGGAKTLFVTAICDCHNRNGVQS
jgi:hypothetical protein